MQLSSRSTSSSNQNRFALRPNESNPSLHLVRLEVDLIYSLNSQGAPESRGNFSVKILARLLGLKNLNETPINLAADWFLTNPSLTTFRAGSFIRIAGFSKPLNESILFNGLELTMAVPGNVVNQDMPDYTLLLHTSSYVRFSYYYDEDVTFSEGQTNVSGYGDHGRFLKVFDSIDPTFVFCPQNITVQVPVNTNATAVSWNRPRASDNREVVKLAQVAGPINDSVFGIGSTHVEYLAFDEYGRTGSCSFHVNVVDAQKPTISCPSDKSFILSASAAKYTLSTDDRNSLVPNIHDNSGRSTWNSSIPTSEFDEGIHPVYLTAIDHSNNTASCSFVITVSKSFTLGTGTIAGISVAVILVALSLALLIVFFARRHRKSISPQNFDFILDLLNDVGSGDSSGPRVPRELRRSHVKVLDVLGEGNFGEVCKGMLTETPPTPGYLVAIKTLRASFDADRTSLLQEAALMAQFDSPFVVGFIGVVTIGSPLMVLLEFCEHGSLERYLKKADANPLEKHVFGADIAEGLQYLASINVVHRDVAARNVLVSSDRRAKISDFGMSRETNTSEFYQSKGGQVPVRWTAPEALEERKYSSKSDCWSFGIVLYEIWTRAETPYADMTNQKVWTAVLGGYRLTQPLDSPAEVYSIMLACWNSDPDERPLFEELVAQLREFERSEVSRSQRSSENQYDLTLLDNLKPAEEHVYVDFTSGNEIVPAIVQDQLYSMDNLRTRSILRSIQPRRLSMMSSQSRLSTEMLMFNRTYTDDSNTDLASLEKMGLTSLCVASEKLDVFPIHQEPEFMPIQSIDV